MSVYRNLEGPFTKKDFEVSIPFPHEIVTEFSTFRHCNLPLMGVGPNGLNNKFLYLDKYIDNRSLKQIRAEVAAGEKNNLISFNKIVANGIIPTAVNGQKSVDSYIYNLSKYEKDKQWVNSIASLKRKGDIKLFFHDYFKISTAWQGLAMFRKYSGLYEDKANPSEWLSLIEGFPSLRKFVESLPFKHIGYVMIFKSTGSGPVLIHRDFYPTNHTVNFINFRLDQKPRPFFLYDVYDNRKQYINIESDSYFFNEIDPHGLDPEPESRLTLRVEGQFLEGFKDQIGLHSNDTFNWSFEHCQNFINSGNFLIEPNTDI